MITPSIAFQWLTIIIGNNKTISTQQRLYWLDQLIEEMSDFLTDEYGTGNWLIIPTSDLPADFSVDTYTIENGELFKASAKIIAEREAAKQAIAAAAEIEELKAYLISTDWVVTKCMELNTPITELYPAIHAERNDARAKINELEGGTNE